MKQDSSLGLVRKRGLEAYEYRRDYCCTWDEVASAIGYNSANSAYKGAKIYASKHGLIFPLPKVSNGAIVYNLRATGYTWIAIARRFGENGQRIRHFRHMAYKWARREGRLWPPSR